MADTVTVITPACFSCRRTSDVTMTQEQYDRLGKDHIQDIFPELSDADREVLITGTHPKCWDDMFAGLT